MKHVFMYASMLVLTACSISDRVQMDSAPTAPPPNLQNVPNAIPKYEPKSRGGNPSSYQVFGKTYFVKPNSLGYKETGTASWYGTKFHGRKTSNGETYNMYEMTAAHKTLPIPTYVKVKNLANNKEIIVRVNDRGPFHGNRIIDLSYVAAAKLDMLGKGTATVEVEAINTRKYTPKVATHKQAVTATTNIDTTKKIATSPINTKPPPQQKTPNTKVTRFFYLQAGAFKNKANAEKLMSTIRQQHISPEHISIQQISGSLLYRVHIGPYSSLSDADIIRSQLIKAGISNPHYIQN